MTRIHMTLLGCISVITAMAALTITNEVMALPTYYTTFMNRYGATTDTCRNCHNTNSPTLSNDARNLYGMAFENAKITRSPVNALIFIEQANSDGDMDSFGHPCDNLEEINDNKLPGFTNSKPSDCGEPPTADNDSYNATFQTQLTVTAPGVLSGDDDPDGDALTAVLQNDVNDGTLALDPDGSFIYMPDNSFSGPDSFKYFARDASGAESGIAMVSITVGTACSFNVDSTNLAFGNVILNETSTLDITVANNGTADCSITNSLATATGEFSRTPESSLSLTDRDGIASETTVSVNYTPTDEGTDTATLSLISNDPNNPQTTEITLTGTGVDPPVITVLDREVVSNGYVTEVTPDATAVDNGDGEIIPDVDPPGPYRPGRHILTYTATDQDDNTSTATQTLDILPLVTLAGAQITGEGRAINVPVLLNGEAPTYPVSLDYTVDGTANSLDHDLVAGNLQVTSGTSSALTINIADDGIDEADEQIVITLTSVSGNAALSNDVSHTVVITERNIEPTVLFDVNQAGVNGPYVYTGQGTVTVTANASDPNGDALTFDWSSTDPALGGTAAGNQININPATLSPGSYQTKVLVSDGVSQVAHTAILAVATTAAPPVLSAGEDSDGDGTEDATEGRSDADGDGLPDYLDPVDDPTSLNGRVLNTTNNNFTRLMVSSAGLSLALGNAAIGAQAPSELPMKVGARLFSTDVKDAAGNIISAPGFNIVSGVYDFEIRGLSDAKRTGRVVIPLTQSIPEQATFLKFSRGAWSTFVETATDGIRSGSSDASSKQCPPPGDSSYTTGLTAFDDCLELTLTDGGPNDADGEANGVIKDPGAVVVPAGAPTTSPDANSSPGGAGALDWWWLMMLTPLLWLQYRSRQGQAND